MTQEEAAILRRYLPKTMLVIDAAQTLMEILRVDESVEHAHSVRGINNCRIRRFSRVVEAGVTQAHENLDEALKKLGGIPLPSIDRSIDNARNSKVKS